EPLGVPRNAPLPVYLHNAAQLAIGRGVEIVLRRTDRDESSERLVAALVLRIEELGAAHAPFELGEEMAEGLLVVPNVRARSFAAAVIVAAPFPRPKAAV